MDFELSVGGQVDVFDNFELTIERISRHLAQWNNLDSDHEMVIKVNKIVSATDTLGVNVSDVMMVEEVFGGIQNGMTEEEYINAKRSQNQNQ